MWIVGALYGGYVMANVFKWYWWRFNGYGYFWGMVAGMLGGRVLPTLLNRLYPDVYDVSGNSPKEVVSFPIIFAVSLAGCWLGSLLTPPDDVEVLKKFHPKTRPWGCLKLPYLLPRRRQEPRPPGQPRLSPRPGQHRGRHRLAVGPHGSRHLHPGAARLVLARDHRRRDCRHLGDPQVHKLVRPARKYASRQVMFRLPATRAGLGVRRDVFRVCNCGKKYELPLAFTRISKVAFARFIIAG